MKLVRGLTMAVALVAISASSAMATFTTTPGGTQNSAGPVGNASNSTWSENYAGAEFFPVSATVVGTLTDAGIGTWAREAVFRICNPNSCFNMPTSALTTTQGGFGSLDINATTPISLTGTSIGLWTFEAFETFDDGAGIDATWTNLSITINAGPPPPPPPPAFSGNFTGTPNVLTPNNKAFGTTIWDHNNPQPGLTDGAGELATTGRYTGFAWDLVGNEVGYRIDHAGGPLDLSLTGLSTDLDLVLLDSTGIPTNTVAVSQGFSGSASESISLGFLAAGTYYAVVDTFGSGNAGSDYSLTYIPEPGTICLLALGVVGLIRRRR